jgi:hypothetical protein
VAQHVLPDAEEVSALLGEDAVDEVGRVLRVGSLVADNQGKVVKPFFFFVTQICRYFFSSLHRDKTRGQMPAKMFPHLKLICLLFMGPTLGFDTKQRNSFLKKSGVFYHKNKLLTILFIVKYEKITL